MNLYEAVSKNIKANNDLVENLEQMKKEYEVYITKQKELYLQIIDVCPEFKEEDNNDLDFLGYLFKNIYLYSVEPITPLNVFLISKGYKDKTDDFDKLVELLISYLTI